MHRIIRKLFYRNSIHKFGKVVPFQVSQQPAAREVPEFLRNTPKKAARKQAGVLVTREVVDVSERIPMRQVDRPSPILEALGKGKFARRDAVAETTMIGTQASIRSALRRPTRTVGQHRGHTLALQMNFAAGRETEAHGPGHLPLTAYTPNDYLGFPEDWQDRISDKASGDKLERFDRLRNSLDHYAAEFATSKEARNCFRANYAEMRQIFFEIGKDVYVPSPHDVETW